MSSRPLEEWGEKMVSPLALRTIWGLNKAEASWFLGDRFITIIEDTFCLWKETRKKSFRRQAGDSIEKRSGYYETPSILSVQLNLNKISSDNKRDNSKSREAIAGQPPPSQVSMIFIQFLLHKKEFGDGHLIERIIK